jgi:hypothetical protein
MAFSAPGFKHLPCNIRLIGQEVESDTQTDPGAAGVVELDDRIIVHRDGDKLALWRALHKLRLDLRFDPVQRHLVRGGARDLVIGTKAQPRCRESERPDLRYLLRGILTYKPTDLNRDWSPRFSTLRDKNGWIRAKTA